MLADRVDAAGARCSATDNISGPISGPSGPSESGAENQPLPGSAPGCGEPAANVEEAVAEGEPIATDPEHNEAALPAGMAALGPQQANTMPESDDQWYEDEDDNPHDDFAALGFAAPLLAETGSEAPPRPVAQFPLIPYQLSGLAMYVPLPPASPLRQFVLSRKRPSGQSGRPRKAHDDEPGSAYGRDPVEPI